MSATERCRKYILAMTLVIAFVAFILLLPGCAALELADMVFDDDCMFRGTVSEVQHDMETSTIWFTDGGPYTCATAIWVQPGNWIEVRKIPGTDGCMFDE